MNQVDFYYQYPSGSDSGSNTRLFLFLIFSVCVGLLALLWAFHFLLFYKGRISAFIIFLLLTDLFQLLLNLIMAIFPYLIKDTFFQFWSSLNMWGFVLHQLVALQGILTRKYPLFSDRIFSLPCYIIITILVSVCFMLNMFAIFTLVKVSSLFFGLGTTLASLSLLAVSFTITCKAPPTPGIKSSHLMFTVAMVTFVMLYFPFMLVSYLFFIMYVPISWTVMSVCLMSLRVISDPILCVLVCRGNLRDVQTPQTHIQPNADQTAIM